MIFKFIKKYTIITQIYSYGNKLNIPLKKISIENKKMNYFKIITNIQQKLELIFLMIIAYFNIVCNYTISTYLIKHVYYFTEIPSKISINNSLLNFKNNEILNISYVDEKLLNYELPIYIYSIISDYYLLIFFLLIGIFLAFFLFIISYILGTSNTVLDAEKISAYECGFSPIQDTGKVLDFKLYKIAILFLIFDIEIIFLMPWSTALLINSMLTLTYLKLSLPFLFMLFLGIYIESKDKIYHW